MNWTPRNVSPINKAFLWLKDDAGNTIYVCREYNVFMNLAESGIVRQKSGSEWLLLLDWSKCHNRLILRGTDIVKFRRKGVVKTERAFYKYNAFLFSTSVYFRFHEPFKSNVAWLWYCIFYRTGWWLSHYLIEFSLAYMYMI